MADPGPIKRIFTALLILGVPGSGKTSLFSSFAEYLWEVHRKVLLLYSWDGGAIPTGVQRRMKQGLIRFWRARTRSAEGLGIETVYLASKGYWPASINAQTGETAPAVTLVAPVTTAYTALCPAGHELITVPGPALLQPQVCPSCKTLIDRAAMKVNEAIRRTKGFEEVGGVGYDGLTSMCNVVMEHMDHARGAGQIGGEKPAFGGVVTSGIIKLGGNNRADVGFGQTRGAQFVHNSLSIPYLVEGPVFTALSMEATDEGGLPIVGAKLPGRAATDEASAWFGNVTEMSKVIDDTGKSHFCLYLRPFTDAQGRRHLLKTSSSPLGTPTAVPAVLIDPPEGEGQPGSVANLGSVFRMLDADLAAALAVETIGTLPATPPDTYGEPAHIVRPAPTLPLGPPPVAPVSRPAVGAPVGTKTEGAVAMPAPPGLPPPKAPQRMPK